MQRLSPLVAMDYNVMCVDSRGSTGRGMIFEQHLKGALGAIEYLFSIFLDHYSLEMAGLNFKLLVF